MIKVKTAELSGSALDWAVGVAVDGKCIDCHGPIPFWTFPTLDAAVWAGNVDIGIIDRYQPSTDWSQGGPLLEEHVTALNQSDYGGWWAHSGDHVGEAITPLVALCRAIVASKLGDTVQVPADLIGGAA